MPNGDGSARKEARRINVLATGSVDQTIKVGRSSTPLDKSWLTLGRPLYRSGHPSTIIIFFLNINHVIFCIYNSPTHIPPRAFFVVHTHFNTDCRRILPTVSIIVCTI